MATVVTVHGTFAHSASGGKAEAGPADRQWWQPGSVFEQDIRTLLVPGPDAKAGNVDVTRFEWSGENSELARRDAGKRLYGELKALDAKGEPYCVVGHSHGGSVVGWALLESAARKDELKNLQRWITVGTPFVNLRREALLIQRLNLFSKVILVASLMLLMMFLVYLAAEMLDGDKMLIGRTFPSVLLVTGAMMSLPILVFYVILKYRDGQSHAHYRRAVRGRANQYFAGRWQSLTHVDDEAVQGLAFLPGAKLDFIDRSFAVSAITLSSVVALPLLYLLLLESPKLMMGLGNWLKTSVYESNVKPETEKSLRDIRAKVRESRQQPVSGAPTTVPQAAARRAVNEDFRAQRRAIAARDPNFASAERALRFKQRFFERDGKACEGGQLCGKGEDLKVNSALLLHLVTDELSAALGGEGADNAWERAFWSLALPAVVVPIIFGLLGLGLMLLIRTVANAISHVAANALNVITNAEVRRAAFGNDTEGEVAVGAVDRPTWVERSPPRLPSALGDLVTAYSNGIANQSLSKFRSVIGRLASTEPAHTADTAITTYFTWKELVHSSYFDVPEFRKLVAQSVSRVKGFAPSASFQSDADFARTAQWLAEIEGAPGTTVPPAAKQPTASDAGAVAAAVASTVKVEP